MLKHFVAPSNWKHKSAEPAILWVKSQSKKCLHAEPSLCYTASTMKPHRPSTEMGAVALDRVRGEAIIVFNQDF
jgi:hypothetical protein